MKKSLKNLLIASSSIMGATIVAGSTAAGIVLNQEENTKSASVASYSVENGVKVNETTMPSGTTSESSATTGTSNSITNEDSNFTKFIMSIANNDSTCHHGNIKFEGTGDSDSIQVSPGQTIKFIVTTTNSDYILGDLWVYASNNHNVSLEITQISETEYSITMPPITIDDKPNPFYSSSEIKVTPIFCKKSINFWKYEFPSRSYVINVESDSKVYDDKDHNELLMEGGKTRNIQYRIYMNGHDLQIRNITIPSGAQLMFLNNIKNEVKESKMPTVSLCSNTWLTKVDNANQIDVQGGIGRFSSVNYGQRMKDYFEPNW